MGKFDSQVERMRSLMTYGLVSESSNQDNNHSMEYSAKGADGRTYGIIKECNKYYIKVATPGKEKLVEGYDYLGGFMNKGEYEYSSYSNALKQFELKMRSINEACEVKVNIDTLDPYKKEDLVIEGTQKMKDEIARQRQIMNNVCAIMNESAQIGMNNTGNPEAPKTSGLDVAKSAPFTDKAEAKLDVDLKANANDPEKQGGPFGDKEKAEDYEDAKYVPDNSVANKKPSGGKVVRINEDKEDEELLLDDETEEMPEEEPVDDEVEDTDFEDEDFEEDFEDEDILPDDNDDILERIAQLEAELEMLKSEVCGDGECEDFDLEDEEMPEEEEEPIQEARTKGAVAAAKDLRNVADTRSKSFKNYERMREIYAQLVNGEVDPEMADELYQEAASLTDEIVNGNEGNDAVKDGARKLLNKMFDVCDELVYGAEDAEFDVENAEYNAEKDASNTNWISKFNKANKDFDKPSEDDMASKFASEHDGDFDDMFDEDDYMNESLNRLIKKMIKEEMVKLNDFGKHPGYRKKPMTLPTTGEDKNQWGEDWNDESVYSEEPFGQKIGDSAPFEKVVSKITESVFNDIKKKL